MSTGAVTRLPASFSRALTGALAAALVLPGAVVGLPVQALTTGPGAQPEPAAEGTDPTGDDPDGRDEPGGNDPDGEERAEKSEVEAAEFPEDARFVLYDDAYLKSTLTLRNGDGEAQGPVFRIPSDDSGTPEPEEPGADPSDPEDDPRIPDDVIADSAADLGVRFDHDGPAAAGLDQPYTFAVTAITGGRLTITGRDDRINGGTDTTLIDAGPEATDERWAFDVDHAFSTTWSLEPDRGIGGEEPPSEVIPPLDDETAPIMCVALESRSTDERGGTLPTGKSARTVLTFAFGEGPVTQSCGNDPARWPSGATAPTGDPAFFPGDASVDVDWTKDRSGDFHPGPGLDLSGRAQGAWAGIRFELYKAPENGAVTYRNSSLGNPGSEDAPWFHANGYNERRFTAAHPSGQYYRALPSRDAHASWRFTESGTYCVAAGVRAYDEDDADAGPLEVTPEILRFTVGDDADASVDCEDGAPETIEIPAPGDGEGPTDGIAPPEDNANGKIPARGMEPPAGPGEGGIRARDGAGDGGMRAPGDGGGPGASATPSPTPSTPATRIQQAPPLIQQCPVEATGTQQVRSGRIDIRAASTADGLTGGFTDLRGAEPRTLDSAVSVVIPSTSSRSLGFETGELGPAGTTIWSTALGVGTSVPRIGWDFRELAPDEAGGTVTLSVGRVEGPGDFAILDGGAGNILADASTPLTAETGQQGTAAFAFNRPGDYTVTFDIAAESEDGESLGETSVKMDFVVADTNSVVGSSPLIRALVTECAGMNLHGQFAGFSDSGPNAQTAPEATDPQSEDVLGDQWWLVAGIGFGLACLLAIAVLVVLMREGRR
ncbi:hypothetical protein [Brevibacterium sp. CS2]|uniref:hypothetical protein n=1 Tax=Brevibacterium sp. CS2 TaxID=2575923 RepID=UPI0010C7D420|nr:hypothetical protein [Brevibacterium sp. CS2]QCP04479.1 hypothetical protein FDF13_03530 [Brevibacterium sp. CS2]